MSGYASLEAFIEGVENLRRLNETVAKEAEKDVADAVRETARQAQTPTGEAWAPRKEDGGLALRGAADAIESSTKGTAIVLRIGPPWVFHHYGAGGSSTTKGAERLRKKSSARRAELGQKSKFHAPRRQILPNPSDVPESVREAIQKAAEHVIEKAVG